jgi:anti-anti-sigma factor
MDARCTTRPVGDAIVVALDGTLDVAALPLVHDTLRRAVAEYPSDTIVVDLEGVVGLDDAVLGVMLGAAADLRTRGAELWVVCAREATRAVLVDRRLDRLVPVADSIVEVQQSASIESRAGETLYDRDHG